MNILLVSHSPNLYGAEKSLCDLAEGLSLTEENVTVLCPGEGPLTDRLKELGVKVLTMPFPGWGQRRLFQVIRLLVLWPLFVLKLKKLLMQHRINVVYNNTINGIYAPFAACLSGIPFVWHIREEMRRENSFLRFLILSVFKFLDGHMVFNSKATLSAYSKKTYRNWQVIYNGVKIPRAIPYKKQKKKITIGFAGQMIKRKQPGHFIRAMSIAVKSVPQLQGIMVGDGILLNEMKVLSQKLKMDNHLKIPGYIHPLSDFYSAADIFVLSSEKEPFGRVLIEAMSYGCPVIASRTDGVPEVVVDGINGFLVAPDNIPEFAEKIIILCQNPDLRLKMGRAARHHVMKYFSVEEYQKQLIAAIISAGSEKRK